MIDVPKGWAALPWHSSETARSGMPNTSISLHRGGWWNKLRTRQSDHIARPEAQAGQGSHAPGNFSPSKPPVDSRNCVSNRLPRQDRGRRRRVKTLGAEFGASSPASTICDSASKAVKTFVRLFHSREIVSISFRIGRKWSSCG